jgi:two-component system cell cycle response regulator
MKKIFYIDNSLLLQKILKNFFAENGFELITGRGMNELKETLLESNIELVITSLELENGKGEELIDYINENYGHIPIIVLSSNEDINIRKKLFSKGVIDFITKENCEEKLLKYLVKLNREDKIYHELQKIDIAILEDNEFDFKIMQKILNLYNIHNIDYFKYAANLLKNENIYTLYLIDLVLIDLSGEQVILELREKNKTAIIIAISGVDHYKTISNVLLSGADDYIVKPYNENIFMARINSNMRTFLLNQQMAQMVITDGLTGVKNHKYIYERLEEEIHKAKRYHKQLSIILLDIDHFKEVNDTHGHQTGDIVLKQVAQLIKENIRNIDILGRYGGEEFIVILPETNEPGAFLLAERIRKSFMDSNFSLKNIKLTISGGVAALADDNALSLIDKADKLLYVAKKNGRNRIEK